MKKIYINNTKRILIFGKAILVPGSNVVEEIETKIFPQLETMIEEDEIEVSENVAGAMKKANTKEMVEALASIAKNDEKVKTAAKNRKQQLEKLDEEAKAIEKAAREKETEEGV